MNLNRSLLLGRVVVHSPESFQNASAIPITSISKLAVSFSTLASLPGLKRLRTFHEPIFQRSLDDGEVLLIGFISQRRAGLGSPDGGNAGTTDAIFAVRQHMETHRERQKGLHMVFIDLDKAYDRVPRQ